MTMLSSHPFSGLGSFARRHVRETDISGHPGAQLVLLILQPDLDSEYLADAVLYCLDVARRELCLAIDLLHRAGEFLIPEGIAPGPPLLAKLDVTQPRLWHVNADPKVLRQNQGRQFLVRCKDVADFHV